MKETQITVFIAEDEVEFRDRQECVEHEKYLKFKRWYENYNYIEGDETRDIYKWLKDNKERILKFLSQ